MEQKRAEYANKSDREKALAAALAELIGVAKSEKEKKLLNLYCSQGEQKVLFEKLLETKNAVRIKVLTATIKDLRDAKRRDEEMQKEKVDIGLKPLPQNLGVEEIIYYNDI